MREPLQKSFKKNISPHPAAAAAHVFALQPLFTQVVRGESGRAYQLACYSYFYLSQNRFKFGA